MKYLLVAAIAFIWGAIAHDLFVHNKECQLPIKDNFRENLPYGEYHDLKDLSEIGKEE